METMADKIERLEASLSPAAHLAAKGHLSASSIMKMTKRDMVEALLTMRAYHIQNQSKQRQNRHYTIGG